MNDSKIQVVYRKTSELIPYENNPRKNDAAVDEVAASIRQFGFKVPVIVDREGVVVAGHTRLKAAKKLKIDEVPCILADDLDEEQINAFRLADNKTSERSEWDNEKLLKELEKINTIDMKQFGFDLTDEEAGEDDTYTSTVNIPQYEVQGLDAKLTDLVDSTKCSFIIDEINAADGITEEERQFLIKAAYRHNVFNYRNIAEYYANASPEMQALMERSALVIIDVDNAIANGYARLQGDIEDMIGEDDTDA